MKEQNQGYEIDIFETLKLVWKRKTAVILFVVLTMVLTLLNGIFLTPYTYTADGTIYVSSENKSTYSKDDYVDANDIYTARILSTTYIETLYLRSFLADVSRDIGGLYTWEEIGKMVDISIVNETELLTVSTTAYSPQDAYIVTSSILKLAPEKLTEVAKGGSIKIIDDVVMPLKPNGKGTLIKTILMGILASIAAVAFVLLLARFDTKVHKSEDLEKRYGISILGILNN